MRIQKSSVLKPTNKTISMVNNCLFAAEGPNCAGKLDLGSLNMHYDSFFSSKMTLQPNDKDMPIMYGFLGTEVTFLTIVPDYNINPQVCPPDAYIEFFYEDQPLITRTFTDILMLSGNDLHRIPQIYVHNPTDAVVELNIMVANLDINQISAILNPTFEEVGGLSFNSIITDQIYGINCTGSTQFEILDPLATGNTQMIISYASIDIMKIDGDTITIITKVDEPIKLRFLSEFNALQAFSRMNWVYEVQDTRSAPPGSPGLDTTGPDIFTILTSPITNLPLDNVTFPYTKTDIINRLILSVFDYDDAHEIRDGEIDIHNGDVIIYDKLRDETVEEITRDSQYKITIIYQDLAGNRSSHVQDISIDTIGPEIIFTTNVNVSTKIIDDMCIYGTTQTPGRICYNDMLRHMINSIWDAVDGTIDRNDKSKFLIEVQDSGGTNIPFNSVVGVPCTGITSLGDYTVTFRAVDSSGNWTIE
ncbi:MAG: hypothetical protein KAH32_00275, partial [Chlamydiia bacterium]|nr:hypothetical protein [Chlamydiia bacterium]